jgi:glycerophosphoryl diester phosphodiesterase
MNFFYKGKDGITPKLKFRFYANNSDYATFSRLVNNSWTKVEVEIKSTIEGDNIFHPIPDLFSELLITVLKEKDILNRSTIQCFDVRTLQYIKRKHPQAELSFLVENANGHLMNIEKLGFLPDIYSPEHLYVNEALMAFCKSKNISVIPWTINHIDEMKRVVELGVNGIISDYPDLYLRLKEGL